MRDTLKRDVVEYQLEQLLVQCPRLERINNTTEYLFVLVVFHQFERPDNPAPKAFIRRVFNQLLLDYEKKLRKRY